MEVIPFIGEPFLVHAILKEPPRESLKEPLEKPSLESLDNGDMSDYESVDSDEYMSTSSCYNEGDISDCESIDSDEDIITSFSSGITDWTQFFDEYVPSSDISALRKKDARRIATTTGCINFF